MTEDHPFRTETPRSDAHLGFDASRAETPRPDGDLGFDLPSPTAISGRRVAITSAIVVVGLGTAFAFGYLPRRKARETLEANARSAESELPRVEVIAP
jgi:hypothetical protein